MRYLLIFGLLSGLMAHAETNCRAQAQAPAEKFVAAFVPTLRPRITQDLKVYYASMGIEIKDAQVEFQDSSLGIESADVLAVTWDWPQVVVHLADHTETLFAPLAQSVRMTVNMNPSSQGCELSGRIGGGYLQVHYYNLDNFAPIFADTFLDTPVFSARIENSPAGF
jgi:hypothetical protein